MMLNHLQNGTATDPVSVFGILDSKTFLVHFVVNFLMFEGKGPIFKFAVLCIERFIDCYGILQAHCSMLYIGIRRS